MMPLDLAEDLGAVGPLLPAVEARLASDCWDVDD